MQLSTVAGSSDAAARGQGEGGLAEGALDVEVQLDLEQAADQIGEARIEGAPGDGQAATAADLGGLAAVALGAVALAAARGAGAWRPARP